MTTTQRLVGRRVLLAAAVGLASCDAGEAPPPAAPDATEAAPAVVGAVKLSDTHTITFLDYGDGEGGVQETLNIDNDADAPVKLVGMSLEGRNLGDVYRLFAGERMDQTLLGKLQAIDARAAARLRTASPVPPEVQRLIDADTPLAAQAATGAAPAQRAPAPAITTVAGGDGLEVRTGAVTCTEPSWADWTADDGWFYQNYCGPTSKACYTEASWANTGWHAGGWWSATGFAQSFCSTATWYVQKLSYGGFPSYGITQSTLVNVTLQPRYLQTNAWVNIASNHSYFGQVTSTLGLRCGLAFNAS